MSKQETESSAHVLRFCSHPSPRFTLPPKPNPSLPSSLHPAPTSSARGVWGHMAQRWWWESTGHPSLSRAKQTTLLSDKEVSVVQSCSLFSAPWTVALQAPLSTGFSRQEYWSGLQSLLQGIFLTQWLNPLLLHCRWIIYNLSRKPHSQLWRVADTHNSHICLHSENRNGHNPVLTQCFSNSDGKPKPRTIKFASFTFPLNLNSHLSSLISHLRIPSQGYLPGKVCSGTTQSKEGWIKPLHFSSSMSGQLEFQILPHLENTGHSLRNEYRKGIVCVGANEHACVNMHLNIHVCLCVCLHVNAHAHIYRK